MAEAVSCPHCAARFALTEDLYQRKVRGRKITLRCKQCQGEIPIDETESPRSSRPPPKPEGTSSNEPVISRRASAHPPFAGLWVVSYSEHDDRELTLAQLERAIAAREIDDTTLVWREGMPEWKPIASVNELTLLFDQAKSQRKPKRGEAGPFQSIGAGTFFAEDAPSAADVGRVSTTPELSALLSEHKPPPSKAAPIDEEILKLAATNVGSLDGPPTIDVSELTPSERARQSASRPERARSDWLWILIVIAALLAMVWLVIRPLMSPPQPPPTPEPKTTVKPVPEQKRGE